MQSQVRKIGLLILAIIILPVLIFSIFEIGRLRRNEKDIQDIYRNQLDAILYSINQYSDDILSNQANRIEGATQGKWEEIQKIIDESPAIKTLLQFNTKLHFVSAFPDSLYQSSRVDKIHSELLKSESTLKRLLTYFRGGYRKIEIIDQPVRNEQWIAFLTKSGEDVLINLLIIDPEKFIGKVLDPKIQEVARGKFFITAYRVGDPEPFYSSVKQSLIGPITEKRPFWLFSNYEMGIELRDITIAELARDRMKKNLLVIGFMDIMMLAGAWLIFRNIKKQLELSQLKSDFVSSVSHEIRTPLALISMYVETLEMGRIKTPEKVKEYYNVILNETSRLSAMVNRILSFSQIENKKRKYTPEPCSINEIAEKASSGFRYTLDNKGFKFSYEPGENLPQINADKEAATDAVINLIDNAMKYSGDSKDIAVRTGIDTKFVWIEVEDHGIGISGKNQKYIFDKFFRVTEKNLANKVKGSGLGLAIVKHIMEAHRGDVKVISTPGAGSTFRLLFPIK
ncbi:MAG TPA: HAMP domain-containing sensor histidine kinase [Bacteroidales bacterium]|jgi:two-component system phosphate regulon sensor histidine kinase PhoR|nr:HAMP domain-containing sensor histidine kinase [Bacteroidales bacterium]